MQWKQNFFKINPRCKRPVISFFKEGHLCKHCNRCYFFSTSYDWKLEQIKTKWGCGWETYTSTEEDVKVSGQKIKISMCLKEENKRKQMKKGVNICDRTGRNAIWFKCFMYLLKIYFTKTCFPLFTKEKGWMNKLVTLV